MMWVALSCWRQNFYLGDLFGMLAPEEYVMRKRPQISITNMMLATSIPPKAGIGSFKMIIFSWKCCHHFIHFTGKITSSISFIDISKSNFPVVRNSGKVKLCNFIP